DTSALLRPPCSPAEFTASKWDSAEKKAEFANKLCKFIAADFKESLFTKAFYERLSMTFGHIAHYNREGFFGTYFENLAGKVEFLEHTLQWPCFGDPEYTYSDVEQVIKARLRNSDLLDAYRAMRAAEIEKSERAALKRLSEKYEGAPSAVTPIILTVEAARPTRRMTLADQQSLF
nr:hypothetical protein [Pseudomonadota bacterium]